MEREAREVRRIAKGIFDKKERRTVLRFGAEDVKLSKEKEAKPPKPAYAPKIHK